MTAMQNEQTPAAGPLSGDDELKLLIAHTIIEDLRVQHPGIEQIDNERGDIWLPGGSTLQSSGCIVDIHSVAQSVEQQVLAAIRPGHTDLMVSPESIDAFLEENPSPASSSSVVQGDESGVELKADFVRSHPSGLDDCTYEQIEDALDRAEARVRSLEVELQEARTIDAGFWKWLGERDLQPDGPDVEWSDIIVALTEHEANAYDIAEKAEARATAAEAQLAKAKEALRFYADPHERPNEGPWGALSDDWGKRAAETLAALQQAGEVG